MSRANTKAKNPGRKGRVVAVLHRVLDQGHTIRMHDTKPLPNGSDAYVLPADAVSVERMASQIAECIAGTSGTNMSDDQVARAALAAIGIGAPGKGGGA